MYMYYITPGVLAPLPKDMYDKFYGHVMLGKKMFAGHHSQGKPYTHTCKTTTKHVYGEIDFGFHGGKICVRKAWINFDNDPITRHELVFKDKYGDIRVATQECNPMETMFRTAMTQTTRSLQAPSYMGQLSHVVEPEDNYSLEDFMAEEAETEPTSYDAEQDMDEFMAGVTFDVYPGQKHDPLDIDWGSFPMPFF